VALLLYVVVLLGARSLGVRLALWAIVAMHVVFFLAPPLLSHDVFSYIAYARLGVANHLNPYTHTPLDIPNDPGFTHAGSIDASSAYGPLFTLLTYPLSPLGVPAAFWILKLVAVLSSLGIVALVWRIAERLGRDALFGALAVGLNPLVLVHVVGGAHNEALTLLIVMAGVLLWVAGRDQLGVAVSTLGTGIKASAGLVVPFLVVGDLRRRLWPALAVVAGLALLGVAAFGTHALDAFSLISSNQDRTSRYSFPYKTAQLLGALLPGNRGDYSDAVRVVFAAAFVAVFLWLLWRTWRALIEPLDAIGWATLAILVASAWLVPWYALWLLPFAALSRDRRLQLATLALCAWMLIIAVPL
jgi:hypothetical protein